MSDLARSAVGVESDEFVNDAVALFVGSLPVCCCSITFFKCVLQEKYLWY